MVNQKFLIRQAQLEDTKQISQIHDASVRKVCAKDYTPAQIEAWVGKSSPENFCKALAQGEVIFVAEIEGNVIGFSSLFLDEVGAVYVAPSYMRQGVGKLLLDAVEKEASSRHIDRLKVSASLNAKPFYQSCGYEIIEYAFHTLRSGVDIPCLKMEKSLDIK